MAAITGQSAILMDAVEGDAPGRGREDFLIEMCLASGRPIQWGAVSFNENAPGRYREQLAFLERARQEGAPMFAQTTAYSPPRCSSWPNTTASTPCPTGLTRSSARPKSGSQS